MYDSIDFDGTTQEYIIWSFFMPDDWDEGTIKFKFYWSPATGASAADGVRWRIEAVAVSNDDPLDAAWGTAVEVTDTVIAVGDLHESAATAAVTVGGTPAAGDMIHIRVSRDVADAADDMTEDAKLYGIKMQYKEQTTSVAIW
jgi:hypothetical protein